MSLQSQIREDMVAAMKARNKETVSLLRVVAGEFGREMNNGIELEDDRVIAILKIMKRDAKIMGREDEVLILDKYIPEMLGENQIRIIVAGIINENGYSSMQEMGKVMGAIKQLPISSQIDMKLANGIVREILSQ